MSLRTLLAASAIALFSTSSNAHMIMSNPPSYGKPDKSPLDPAGANFPCKATSSAGAPVTNMAIGQQQTLSFNGTAVHGGGSCQISLTTDNPATKSSKWMVIHSIEGGCPARNTPGNLPDGADPDTTPDPDTYKFSIPAGITPGAYTLAWTWFNKVGNREMYMNCALIKVTGGSSKRDTISNGDEDLYEAPISKRAAAASFPAMFTANIGNGCTTAEGGDLKFPNPGTSVETNTGYIPMAPVGTCASSGSSSGSSAAAPASGAAASGGASSAPAAASSAAPAAAAAPSAAPAAPASGNSSSSGAGGASPSAASSSGSSAASSSSGSSSGGLLCGSDGKTFAMSGGSGTPVYQPVAAGTSCKNGIIGFAKVKRSEPKFAMPYRA